MTTPPEQLPIDLQIRELVARAEAAARLAQLAIEAVTLEAMRAETPIDWDATKRRVQGREIPDSMSEADAAIEQRARDLLCYHLDGAIRSANLTKSLD